MAESIPLCVCVCVCVCVWHTLYPFIYWWTQIVFTILAIVSNTAMDIAKHIPFQTSIFVDI